MPLLSSHPLGTSTWERGSLKQSKCFGSASMLKKTPEVGDKGGKVHILVTYTKWVNKQKYFSANNKVSCTHIIFRCEM